MTTRRSGTRIKSTFAPFETLEEFYAAILALQKVDLVKFTDVTNDRGHVSVYLCNSQTGEGHNGGNLTFEELERLSSWTKSDTRLKGRLIEFRGCLKQRKCKAS